MKEIKLSQHGKNRFLNLVAIVDDCDFDYLNQFEWYAKTDKNTYYAIRCERKNKKYKTFQMHREVLGVTDSKIEVDHRDHNGLNNQRYNLRTATRSQNCSNKLSHKNSSSKYLGVIWYKPSKKWRARIQKDLAPKSLGLFDNEIDAAIAYNEAAIKLHGEFANLNKIECDA